MGALHRIVTAVRAGVVSGVLLGFAIALVTATTNHFHTLLDTLRLAVAVGLVYGALLGGVGLLVGGLVAAFARGRPWPVGALATAVCVSGTAAIWVARWWEFNWGYPHRWPFVGSFLEMLGLAVAFVVLLAAGGVAVAGGLTRVAEWAGRHRVSANMSLVAGVVVLLAVAGVLSLRPDPLGSAHAPGPVDGGDPSRRATDHATAARTQDTAELTGLLPRPNHLRTLVVGCDGAEWSVIDALFAEGELPHLQRLVNEGVRAPLRTIDDRPSPSLWTSIASSRRPVDTGISDFYVQNVFGGGSPVRAFPRHFGLNAGLLLRDVLGRGAVRVTPVNSGMVRARRLWQILGASGVRVGVVNWLVTWPADAGDASFLVSERAWAAASPARTSGDPFDDPGPAQAALWDPPEIGALLPQEDAAWAHEDVWATDFAERLMAEHSPQVMLVYFRDVDAAEHLSWDEWEPGYFRGRKDRVPRQGPMRDSYLRFDRSLGRLLEAFGPDANVVVVSDHGHGPWFTWLGRGTPGGHTDAPDGIFVAAGPGFRRGSPDGFAPSVYDVTPTVLRLTGLPAAADMEGSVLTDILVDAPLLPVVASYETGDADGGELLPSAADEAMMERLRALGYVR